MSIISAFGDDDHTAADGPYARAMKIRKWLYVFGTAGIMLASGLYDATAVKALLRVIQLPVWLLGQSLLAGLIYLLLQYGAVGFQLRRTYDIVLDERLAYRRSDELARAAKLATDARSALAKHHQATIEHSRLKHTEASQRLQEAENEVSRVSTFAPLFEETTGHGSFRSPTFVAEPTGDVVEQHGHLTARALHKRFEVAQRELISAQAAMDDARIDLEEVSGLDWKETDPQSVELAREHQRARAEFQRILDQNPATRRGYRAAEKGLDFIRLVPPPFFVGYAVFKLAILVF